MRKSIKKKCKKGFVYTKRTGKCKARVSTRKRTRKRTLLPGECTNSKHCKTGEKCNLDIETCYNVKKAEKFFKNKRNKLKISRSKRRGWRWKK